MEGAKLLSNDKKIDESVDTVLCLEDSDFWRICFSDIISMENVVLITPKTRWVGLRSGITSVLCRIHHSWRLNSIIDIPCKSLWNKYDYACNAEVERWIFTDTSVRGYDRSTLKKLKERGIKLYLLFLNPMISTHETGYALNLVKEGFFELIYTIDHDDAKQYGFIFTNSVYSKMNIEQDDSISWKVSYIGAAKNRLSELHSLARLFEKMKSILYISGVKREDQLPLSNVVYNHSMDYASVLRVVTMSDCILEVVQKGQRGFTFRTYEAICYNKKLVTNNTEIKACDFYDPKYIKIYSEIDNTLIDFIKDNTMPNYHYDGRYSPKNLYNDILRREKHEDNYN